MSQDPNLPAPNDFDGDAPLPFVMPPPGPVVQWDTSPADLLDWSDTGTKLDVHPKPGLGDMEAHASLLEILLCGCIRDDLDLVQELLSAIADVQAGRVQLWLRGLWEVSTVAVRPDALWLHWGHFYPGDDLRSFPLNGMEAVLRRWAEAIRHYSGDG